VFHKKVTAEKRTAAKQKTVSVLQRKRLRAYGQRCDVFSFSFFQVAFSGHVGILIILVFFFLIQIAFSHLGIMAC